MSKIGDSVIAAQENGHFFDDAEEVMQNTAKKLDMTLGKPTKSPNAVSPRLASSAHPKKPITTAKPSTPPTPPTGKPVPPQPKDIMARDKQAKEIAALVHDFAEKNHLVVHHGGANLVKSDVWRYVAWLLGLRVVFSELSDDLSDTMMIPRQRQLALEDDDSQAFPIDTASSTYAVLGVCQLYDGDQLVAEGVSCATNDEEFLSEGQPYDTMHLAQTRAFVRAMRNGYGFIMPLAGYSSTPFEEVINDVFSSKVKEAVERKLSKVEDIKPTK